MSGEQSGYSILASPKFAQDLQFLRSRAMADPTARHLYRETQAWAGQQPLSTSKPLDVAEFGRRGQTTSTGPSRPALQKGI